MRVGWLLVWRVLLRYWVDKQKERCHMDGWMLER